MFYAVNGIHIVIALAVGSYRDSDSQSSYIMRFWYRIGELLTVVCSIFEIPYLSKITLLFLFSFKIKK